MTHLEASQKWRFWIDRGGTFTDIVARGPDGGLLTKKLLSENPENYADAALEGMRQFLGAPQNTPLPSHKIHSVKMGTTVATNALLERKGEATLLAITAGLRDVLEIGTQARDDIFALNILKPAPLYQDLIEVDERLSASGDVITPLDVEKIRQGLQAAYDTGYRALAVVLLHAYKNPEHELQIAQIARKIGFTQTSTSHEASALNKNGSSRRNVRCRCISLADFKTLYWENYTGSWRTKNRSKRARYIVYAIVGRAYQSRLFSRSKRRIIWPSRWRYRRGSYGATSGF